VVGVRDASVHREGDRHAGCSATGHEQQGFADLR
jgi:hypothetical protein